MFQQFLKERQYILNVSPRTIEWYEEAFKHLKTPTPTEADLESFVIGMRDAGLRPVSCVSYIRAVNAFLKWAESPLRVPRMKVELRVPRTYTVNDIQKFATCKAATFPKARLKALILTLADTGIRIGEALGLRWTDVDFDDLLITVMGKGRKQRRIPFSLELRKVLFRYKQRCTHEIVFATRNGTAMTNRNVLRGVVHLCDELGITPPGRNLHAFRHTFATGYLRAGGSVLHLQRVLGHSSLEMVNRYAHLNTEDLQRIHEKVSMLGVRRGKFSQ